MYIYIYMYICIHEHISTSDSYDIMMFTFMKLLDLIFHVRMCTNDVHDVCINSLLSRLIMSVTLDRRRSRKSFR
jgi:hypothetical protein